MRPLQTLPIAFVMTLLMSFTTANANLLHDNLLPLDTCVPGQTNCTWENTNITPDPNGDIWIKFETSPGAGDMGHIVGRPNDLWTFELLTSQGTDISGPWGAPFLTDMDTPIPEDEILYFETAGTLVLSVFFFNESIPEIFVHDLHFPCIDSIGGADCLAIADQSLPFIVRLSAAQGVLEFGRWDIPEPGTLALFGLGLAGLGFARRRKTA